MLHAPAHPGPLPTDGERVKARNSVKLHPGNGNVDPVLPPVHRAWLATFSGDQPKYCFANLGRACFQNTERARVVRHGPGRSKVQLARAWHGFSTCSFLAELWCFITLLRPGTGALRQRLPILKIRAKPGRFRCAGLRWHLGQWLHPAAARASLIPNSEVETGRAAFSGVAAGLPACRGAGLPSPADKVPQY